jgi:serine/threonine-protein kinase
MAEAQAENVSIPALEEDTSGGAKTEGGSTESANKNSETTAPLVENKGSAMRTASYVVLGAGVVGVGVGSYFGLTTFSTWSDAKKHCAGTLCDSTGVKLANDAKTDGTASTAAMFVGGALVGVGLVLFFMSPSDKATPPPTGTLTSPKITPAVGPTFAGLSMSGAL